MSANWQLAYTIRDTALGRLLVAATPRGVCLVRFETPGVDFGAELAREFPFAVAERADLRLAAWSDALVAAVDGRTPQGEVPLDVRGSCFERRVWKELAAIPRGETRSYAAVARALGLQRGARAVARACAKNPVPVAVPCHRVITSRGEAGGYSGGGERKLRLLQSEGAILGPAAPAGGWRRAAPRGIP